MQMRVIDAFQGATKLDSSAIVVPSGWDAGCSWGYVEEYMARNEFSL